VGVKAASGASPNISPALAERLQLSQPF